MKHLYLIPFLALGLLSSCYDNNPLESLNVDKETPAKNGELPDSRGYAVPIGLTEQQQVINERLTSFSWKLFAESYKLRDAGQNLLISPVSLEVALGMFVNGLPAADQEELLTTLGLGGFTVDDLNEYHHTMLRGLAEADDVAELHLANSFWYKAGHTVMADYRAVLEQDYLATTRAVDFSLQSTVDAINAWCAEQTGGKIKEILQRPDERMFAAMLNAVYFKAAWKDEFEKRYTGARTFHYADGTEGDVEMMRKSGENMEYVETALYQAVRLPFRNEAFSLFLVLPAEGESIGEVAQSIASEGFGTWGTKTFGLFAMPKLEVEYEENHFAQAMNNINPKFAMGGLDYNVLLPEIDGDRHVSVKQKTFFKADEQGAEAAAVTIISMVTSAYPIDMMLLDRPFIYGIVENSTGCPLFIGYYGDK